MSRILTLLALLLSLAGPGGLAPRAAAQEAPGKRLTWPAPPADPVIGLDAVVKKLAGFEIAVQGTTDGTLRRVEKLKRPAGIAFDQRGRLLITDSRQGLLLRLDLDLGVVLVFGTATTPALERPLGVAAGGDGTIFVADADLGQVVAFSARGEVVATFGGGGLAEPVDVALSPDGSRLFVADSKTDSVVEFDVASRREVDRFGSRGKGVAEFYGPGAVAFDPDGNLLVVDRLNARVQLFDSNGMFTRAIYGGTRSRFSRPRDVAVDSSGRIFVTDEAQSQVQIYRPDLEPLMAFGKAGLGDGEFLGVGGIAVSGDRLAVVDSAGGRVQTFRLFGIDQAAARTVPEPAATSTGFTPIAGSGETPEPEATGIDAEATGIDAEATGIEQFPAAIAPQPEAATSEIDVEVLLIELVGDWAAAWSAQDVERYLTHYAQTFLPASGVSRDRWSAERRQRIEAPTSIEVLIDAVEVDLTGPERAEVTFLQSYRSDRFSDRVRKVLVVVRETGGWKIAAETVLEEL